MSSEQGRETCFSDLVFRICHLFPHDLYTTWFYLVLPKHPFFYILPYLNLACGILHIIRKVNFRHNNTTWAPTFKHLRQFKSYIQIKTANLFCKTWEKGRRRRRRRKKEREKKRERDFHKITCHNLWEKFSQRSWFSGMRCQVRGSQCFGGTCCLYKCLYSSCPPKRFHCNVGTYLQSTWCYFPENCDRDSLQ